MKTTTLTLIFTMFLTWAAISQETSWGSHKSYSSLTYPNPDCETWQQGTLTMKEQDTSNYLVMYDYELDIHLNSLVKGARLILSGQTYGVVKDIGVYLFDLNGNTFQEMFLSDNVATGEILDSTFTNYYMIDTCNMWGSDVDQYDITSKYFGIAFRVEKESDTASVKILNSELSFCYEITTGIAPDSSPKQDVPAQYFDLNGQLVDKNNIVPGIYIIKQGNRTTKKYILVTY